MIKSNINDLIAKASPERLKEIEAAIKDGRADAWTVEQAASARAYLDRLNLMLDRELEKEMKRSLKVSRFPGFAKPLPQGTSLSEIKTNLDKMKQEAAHAAGGSEGKEVTVPSLRVYVKLKVIEKLQDFSNKIGVRDIQAVGREEVPVLVRSMY